MFTLIETPITPRAELLPELLARFAEEGLKRGRQIGCFDFVPSNYAVVYGVLCALPPNKFCEWGSGMGIVAGLSAALGFQSHGVERDARLVTASQELLAEFGLAATIEHADIFESHCAADIYFAYVRAGQRCRLEEHFLATAPDSALFLSCHGADDVRCYRKEPMSG